MERARLVAGTGNTLATLAVPEGGAVEDQPPLIHDQFVALRAHQAERHKLKLIDAALERMKRGSFGLCQECGEPIPVRRLKAIPWACYCVPCQELLDRDAGRALGLTA
ncbi:MAG: TraR/DksA family transcriptional regulator [Bryobacterales bacterium]|nr:TraR/DksA family transcriptional regulator [Bryobacterales bacterium]